MKNRILSILAAIAIAVSLSACQSGETGQDIQSSEAVSSTTASEAEQSIAETTAPDNAEVIYETLAEGQERDWKIEDVLKNDLEIDGIPISLPCTVEELLNTLGDEYSVDESELVLSGVADVTSTYYTGEHVSLILYSHNEPTHTMTSIICDSNNNLNVIGFFSGTDKCVISLKDLTIGSSMNECLKKYGQPNKIKTDDEKVYWLYTDNDCKLNICFENNLLVDVTYCGFIVEDVENE